MYVNAWTWMNQMQNLELDRMLDELGVQKAALSTSVLIGLAVTTGVALLWCFFGLKLIRLWAALLGMCAGFGIGTAVAGALHLDATVALIIGVAAGVLLAVLGAVIYKAGIFLVAWIVGSSAGILFLQPQDEKILLVCVGIGFIIGLLTIWLAEPITMILTGLYGAFCAGAGISLLVPLESPFLRPAVSVGLAVLGIMVQFLMESGKRKRRHLERARRIREENSTENEVEKARAMMEDLDHLPDAKKPKRKLGSGKKQKEMKTGQNKKENRKQNKEKGKSSPAGENSGEDDDITFLDLDE